MASTKITPGDGVKYIPGTEIGVPKGTTYVKARRILDAAEAAETTMTTVERYFDYPHTDVAVAVFRVLSQRYGLAAGKASESFFGTTPADTLNVKMPDGSVLTVPTGDLTIPALGENVRFYVGSPGGGRGAFHAEAPKRMAAEMNAIAADVEAHLREHSIYRGHAITADSVPDFVDLSGFDASTIVFSDEVEDTLDAAILHPIRDTASVIGEGIPVKRAMLLYGPYGTGKTSAGLRIAQVAAQHGWTYILTRPGDDIGRALRMARLYATEERGAVVFVEDLDTQGGPSSPMSVSRLLDVFDGATAKGAPVMLVATTNRVEKLHPGMLRPGRLDYVVHVAGLDRSGTERLLRAVIPTDRLDAATNFDAVYAAMPGFEPAFVRATADRAKSWAIRRSADYVLTTDDLIGAARSLHSQLALLRAAEDKPVKPTLTDMVRAIVASAVNGSVLTDEYGDEIRGGEHVSVPDDVAELTADLLPDVATD